MNDHPRWEDTLGAGTRILIGVLVIVTCLAVVAMAICAVGWTWTLAHG